MSDQNYYRITPSFEPRGEGNGWEDCNPDSDRATLFIVEAHVEGDIWEGVEAFDTWDKAQAHIFNLCRLGAH